MVACLLWLAFASAGEGGFITRDVVIDKLPKVHHAGRGLVRLPASAGPHSLGERVQRVFVERLVMTADKHPRVGALAGLSEALLARHAATICMPTAALLAIPRRRDEDNGG
jgi:hypothetical protein